MDCEIILDKYLRLNAIIKKSLSALFNLDQLFAYFRAEEIQHPYDDNDGQQRSARLVVLQGINPLRKEIADTAAADKPDDGGDTYIDIPVVNGER